MSIMARLTAEYFKRDQGGRTIVYPFGPWGLGYFVPDVVTEQRIRLKLMSGSFALVIFSIAVADALPSFLTRDLTIDAEALIVWFVAVTILQICYLGWLKLLVRGMAPAAERMRLTQIIVAQVWPRWLLRSLLYCQVVGMICAGIVIILIPSSMGLTFLLGIAFSQRFLTSNPHPRGSGRVLRQLLSAPTPQARARNTLALLAHSPHQLAGVWSLVAQTLPAATRPPHQPVQ
jgi:hypothetical protein